MELRDSAATAHGEPASASLSLRHPSSKGSVSSALPLQTPPELARSALDAQRAPELERFFAALAALDSGKRQRPVRVLWYGDSHTAADYWSGALRSALWTRHTPGGPGFLRLGMSSYRHDQASVQRIGRWRIEPESPARRAPQGDGVFGLGGVRASPLSDKVRFSVKLARGALRGRARHTLLFDLDRGGAFVVKLGNTTRSVRQVKDGTSVPGSPILRIELEGTETDTLSLSILRGRPHFYGVIVEGTEAGVVLDTLGIDGARIATTLAWSEVAFEAEVRARSPELVIVAYGTNEAFDGLAPVAYAAELSRLIGRLRRGAPAADCVVLGPPDALETSGLPAARVAEISRVYARTAQELSCAFASVQGLMGGPGAYGNWMRADPQLASGDRVHFTPKGYRRLGELVGEALFGLPAPSLSTLRATNSP